MMMRFNTTTRFMHITVKKLSKPYDGRYRPKHVDFYC